MKGKEKILEGLTFDDVLLVPKKSEVVPCNVVLKTKLTKKLGIKHSNFISCYGRSN